jgi:hypothetical protein
MTRKVLHTEDIEVGQAVELRCGGPVAIVEAVVGDVVYIVYWSEAKSEFVRNMFKASCFKAPYARS